MKIILDEEMLEEYVTRAVGVSPDRPLLLDKFLEDAIESEADAISDGVDAFVPAVMQHIEYAGIHSGDSACVIPPVVIPKEHKKNNLRLYPEDCNGAERCGTDEYSVCNI